jgi:hypothetical protein
MESHRSLWHSGQIPAQIGDAIPGCNPAIQLCQFLGLAKCWHFQKNILCCHGNGNRDKRRQICELNSSLKFPKIFWNDPIGIYFGTHLSSSSNFPL